MTSPGQEDQDQRKINGLEDSKTTIEFLRARLLAERSVSKTARQRADGLAKRVSELEEQLMIVSLQRKKAEKATAAVLSILENHGISDASEEFNSGSDLETNLSDSIDAENKREGRETSSSVKKKENDADTFLGYEIESSSSTGRSLSWKSSKGSLNSLDRRKYTHSNRRCSNSASTAVSSPKRVGKSCRRIKRRDTRSASDKLQNSSAACVSEALPSSANNGPQSLTHGVDENDHLHISTSENGRQAEKSDEDMQRALHQKAQLIGQYEAEEKAQREWEEKYRESNSHSPDSCDPGNYSDVTEERDDLKASQQPYSYVTEERDDLKASQQPYLAGTSCTQNTVKSTEENGTINKSASISHVDMDCLKDEKSCRMVKSDSSASELSDGIYLKNHSQTSAYSNHQSFPVTRSPMYPRGHTTSFSGGSSLQAGQALQTSYELALVSHSTSNGVGSVLGALEQAKHSLGKQISSLPPLRAGCSIKTMEHSNSTSRIHDRSETPALFRLPTDFQFEATASYPGSASRFSSANYSPAHATCEFSTSPYTESRSNSVTGDRFASLTPRPFMYETTLEGGLPSQMRFNPNSSSCLPFSSKFMYPTYPFGPDVVPKLSSGEVFSRNLPRSETGIPPSFSFSAFCPDVVPKLPTGEAFLRDFPQNETGMPPSFPASCYDAHNRSNTYSS